jgi:hypothetical protein
MASLRSDIASERVLAHAKLTTDNVRLLYSKTRSALIRGESLRRAGRRAVRMEIDPELMRDIGEERLKRILRSSADATKVTLALALERPATKRRFEV